jgi:mannitol/fructose-specific phosphotransferase system IIA component (Ntr-type)/nucleotide-binding universal stress UspA family protein
MTRVGFAGSWLFIPIFLISVGMLVDPRVFISDLATWKVAIAMCVTVVATKFLAAMISRRVLGYTSTEGWVMFGLTVNQAAATLAAVVVGFNLGIFDKTVVNGAVMMILVSCLIGSAAIQKYGRDLAIRQAESPEDLALAPKRILVPLRNPEAAPAIMDVAFMIREKQSHEPVYPLAVVQDSDDASSRVAAGERMLNTAVTHAAAADIPAVAVTRLDTNAADGILRAIRELRISTVVMGWTGVSPTRSFIFGSVLDQLLRRSPQQFVVCRLAEPLHTAKRLVLVLPPFAHREIGFVDAVRTVKNLASQSGLDLVLSAREQDIAQMRPIIDKIKPDVRTEAEPVPAIESWLSPRGPALLDRDIFVLLAARENQISWRPSIDRLPRAVMSRPGEASMLVIYPSEEATEALPPIEQQNNRALDLSELFAPDRLISIAKTTDTAELIATVLDRLPEDDADAHRSLAADLERVGREAPIEIAPGIVLLHIHTPRVDRAVGFLATVENGVRFDKVKRDSRAVFVLLTPKSLPAAVHLQHLARIAGLLHDPTKREAILSAQSPEDLAKLF